MNSCICGCGGDTKSRFVPGHDARLKGSLLRAHRAAVADCAEGERAKIEEQLAELAWTYLIDPNMPKPAKRVSSPRVTVPREAKGKKQYAQLPELDPSEKARERERAQRQRASSTAREQSGILEDLEAFGSELGECCGHWHDRHVEQDGRTVCLDCQSFGSQSRFHAVHPFRTILDEAKAFFGVTA